MITKAFRFTAILALGFGVAHAMPASASIVSWSYESDTPVFTDSVLARMNEILSGAGPTITGSLSFDRLMQIRT